MPKTKAYILTEDKHPLAEIARQIWGINICRSLKDTDGAPEPIVRAFRMYTTDDTYNRCCCCGNAEMGKAGGIVVLRTNIPGQHFIAMGICSECLKEPVSTKITNRVFKTLTGAESMTADWKDLRR